ncbi:dihydropteroate synthase [Psychroflexus planctonicus]|uniref:Dihydropteroate synthase n=1 Tax=Psychroflexus planctonicus TaxID=1526575 RepID=A0ABQ1SFF2_9FLAO|nr:dihydropteroate synthase [Psychroflexus planctonicus]GGE30316.1 dihydropteroate synthase [Psychroflexus planctonicus]
MQINCKGNLIDLSTPKVMGVLNLTPDSFYDGGKYKDLPKALKQAEKMLNDGATFIDLGAYSSRPGADHISETEEKKRLIPVLNELIKAFPEILISVDTFRANVAKLAVEAGASMVNDISAGNLDQDMFSTLAKLQVPYIMMHMKGTPQTMKQHAKYSDVVEEVNFYFSEKISQARAHGINDCIIDPGFGFAKNVEQNYVLLQHLEALQFHKVPVLVGLSRKSLIYKLLETTPQQALNGTSVLNTIAIQKKAKILRVHDVKEATEVIQLLAQFN